MPWVNLLVGITFGLIYAFLGRDWSFQPELFLDAVFWLLIIVSIAISYWLMKDSHELLRPIGSDLLIGVGAAIGLAVFSGLGFRAKGEPLLLVMIFTAPCLFLTAGFFLRREFWR